eukprot:CAMPEP_0182535660 /NCGR_PEP_ID=MMETSP1323-20130603/18442_1 /TAXON_ID=236787 /ORGANISM="Florenciella parvula, Strain RCC1693" /LENGTH=32 /DNA_ID= /DNA_START= /DNA_END= /DNA_ORIENTATION=
MKTAVLALALGARVAADTCVGTVDVATDSDIT